MLNLPGRESKRNRSDFIETAVRLFIEQLLRDERNARDLEIINRRADYLNREAADILASQVPVGPEEGFKHDSSIHCDELVSLLKSVLTNFIGALAPAKIDQLERDLRIALDLP